MGDFGKILDQWEHRSGESTHRGTPDMDELLDRYPPETRDGSSVADAPEGVPETRQHTPHRPKRPERLKVDASLDLHGYRLQEALDATSAFIEQSVRDGLRKVVVIHGKGENGQGVLRKEIRSFLERHPSTGAMGYNRGVEGGRGALWVMLRSNPAGRRE